jgi:hypothetical protein
LIESKFARAFVEARQSKSFTFEGCLTRRWLIVALIVGLGLYVGLAWGSWQAYMPNSWLRLGAAWLLWLAPGLLLQQLLWRDISVSQRAITGFGIAVALGGFLGLIATALHLALWFVIGGFTVMTIVCALLLAARARWNWRPRWRVEFSLWHILMSVPVLLACLIVVRLTMGLDVSGDDLTHNAYLLNWQSAAHYDWNEIIFGIAPAAPSRFWLAYWPLNQALFAQWSGLHGVELAQLYLTPFLALTALLATYALARALNLARAASSFALCAQTAALLSLVAQDQAGAIFFNRLVEDKAVAAFILVPLFALAVAAYSKQPTRGRMGLLWFLGAALVLTHPTITGIAAAAAGLFVLFNYLAERNLRVTIQLFIVLIALIAIPLGFRIFDVSYVQKIPFNAEALQRQGQIRRVLEWNAWLYAIHPQLVAGLPFFWTLVAATFSFLQLKRSYAARWICASMLVVLSALLPVTAWAWGLALGTSQIWRIVWFTPFGIAAAYLLIRFFDWRKARASAARHIERIAYPTLATGILILALVPALRGANDSLFEALQPPNAARANVTDLIALKPILDANLDETTVMVGGDRRLNDLLPSVTTKGRVFAFRTKLGMWKLSVLDWAEAVERWNALRKLIAKNSTLAERMAVLKAYNVKVLVARQNSEWVNQLIQAEPERLQLFASSGRLRAYQVKP